MTPLAIGAALLLALQAVPSTPPPMPPIDWSGLPTLRYLRPPADPGDLSGYVRSEAQAGRCARAVQTAAGWSLRVDMVLLATPQGQVRRIVPRAIDCPSVEQYAAGLVSSMARNNIDTEDAAADSWYRASLTFVWPA